MSADGELRILQISAQFPFPARSGFETRVSELARHLASRHDVTLLSYSERGKRGADERLPPALRVETADRAARSVAAKRAAQLASVASRQPFTSRAVYSREMQAAIDRLCASRRFDVVQLESSVLGGFRFPQGVPLILDEHNVEYEVFERMHAGERSLLRRSFSRLEHLRFRRFEQELWRRVAACAVTSDREERIVNSHAPGTPTAVVPNGVDLEYFRPSGVEPDSHSVVFNGVLDYRPNLDAATYLVDEIWPLITRRAPEARLTVVGRGGTAELRRLERPGVVATGEVPDIRPYLDRAAVVVVPIRMGGGTRLKVVEALAMARPVVSTTLGCEGVNVRHGEHLLIADTEEAFAASVLRVFEDASLARALGRAGRALTEAEYSWEFAGARLDDLYHRVLARRRPSARAPQVTTSNGAPSPTVRSAATPTDASPAPQGGDARRSVRMRRRLSRRLGRRSGRPRVCIVRQKDPYEPMVQREAEALVGAGFDVDVICMRDPERPKRTVINDVLVLSLPTDLKKASKWHYAFSYAQFFLLAAATVAARHVRRPYAAVQVNTMPDFLVFAAAVPKLLGAKVVAYMHEPTPELAQTLFGPGRLVSILAAIEQRVLRFADHAVAVTPELKQRYVERGASADRISVVLNGVDPATRLAGWVPPSADSKERFTVICHGTIEDRYGQDTLIEAARLLREEMPDLRVVLTGRGTAVDEMVQTIDAYELGDVVHFEGWASEQRLNDLLHTADVGVVAQKASPYSHLVHTNKMVDYWIFGLPVIASRLEAVSALYDDSTIEYYEPGDPADLARAIRRLHDDPRRREELARNGRLAQERHGWSTQKRAYLAVYEALVGRGG